MRIVSNAANLLSFSAIATRPSIAQRNAKMLCGQQFGFTEWRMIGNVKIASLSIRQVIHLVEDAVVVRIGRDQNCGLLLIMVALVLAAARLALNFFALTIKTTMGMRIANLTFKLLG